MMKALATKQIQEIALGVAYTTETAEDLRLHPNEDGFAYYAKNLYDKIQKYL